MTDEQFNAQQDAEFDFENDSTVEVVEGVWTITEAVSEDTDGDNGSGTRHVITFEGDALPFPITVRQFVSYTSKQGKDTAWVKRSRGILKGLAKAATGEPRYTLQGLIGKQVRGKTKDDGNGYITLSRFRAVEGATVGE